MTDHLETFTARFDFKPELDRHVGIEREWFILDETSGLIVPRSVEVIRALGGVSARFTYELSACQGESRHGPCRLSELRDILVETDDALQRALKPLGLRAVYQPVGPAYIPLEVYPDERYLRIATILSQDKLSAACRSAGTHVHVGKKDRMAAIQDYEAARIRCDELVRMGDLSDGERFRLYETVQPEWHPRPYPTWEAFHADAEVRGFAENPRDNWQIIRITTKGSVEFRMFDSTHDVDMIVAWASECLN